MSVSPHDETGLPAPDTQATDATIFENTSKNMESAHTVFHPEPQGTSSVTTGARTPIAAPSGLSSGLAQSGSGSNVTQTTPNQKRGEIVPPVVPGIQIGKELGKGGMGVVYEAVHERYGKVAVKVLHTTDERVVRYFQAECRIVGRIDHAAIVPVLETFVTDRGNHGCVMELVRGATLEDLVDRGEVPTTRAVAVVASAARAPAAAHDAGLGHRGLVGTPRYMAPEQAQAFPTSPATDVWALGVVLYELLTGRPPFDSNQLSALICAIVADAPLAPRSLNPAIGPETETIVLRCLEKSPDARFASAGALAAELEKVVSGTKGDALAPVILNRLGDSSGEKLVRIDPKPDRDEAPVHYRYEWELDSSPEQLWPLVSDTEKFNRAIGLPAVQFSDAPDGKGGVVRTGRMKRLGLEIEWVEHPYEWLAPERQSVLRVYSKGPLAALWSEVNLVPRAGGGTSLVHELWSVPRGFLGRIVSFVELRMRAKANMGPVYEKFDEKARLRKESDAELEGSRYPLAKPEQLSAEAEALLVAGLAAIRSSGRSWARLVPLLEAELREALDTDAATLRPYALARRWKAERLEVLKLCFEAMRKKLLEIGWYLICPVCRVPASAVESLASLRQKSHCRACDLSYDNDFARSVELVFKPSAKIRPIPLATYCLGGPGNARHVVLQQEIEPGETRALSVSLPSGSYRFMARGVRQVVNFEVIEGGVVHAAEVAVEDGALQLVPALVGAGRLELKVRNASVRRRVVRLERAAWRQDILTALEACGHPELRELAPAFGTAEPLSLTQATFLAAALREGASQLAKKSFRDIFSEVVETSGGAVAPREPAFAAFPDPSRAVEAAFELHSRAKKHEELAREGLHVSVHAGPAVAVFLEGRADYQGAAPTIAVSLLDGSHPGEIATTHMVLGGRGVSSLVGTRETRVQKRRLGPEGYLSVVYLGPGPSGRLPSAGEKT
ncbi:protein kinase [bacterium]|nr:protein kinase [bacterium]